MPGTARPVNDSDPMTIDADWVVTMAGPAIRTGRVVVEAGRIAAVGAVTDVPIRGQHRRLSEAVLLPGLVNAHCHLELSAYHGVLPPSDLWSWLAKLVMLRLQPDAAAREQAAVAAAVRSMLQSGTTCVGDISRAAWLPGILSGETMRKICYVELISGAMSPPADMTQLQQRLAALPGDDPLLVKAISPHAPYTVKREDMEACVALATREGLPLAIHLAETREEIEWLRWGTGRIQEWHTRLIKDPPRCPRLGPTEYALAAGFAHSRAAALIHMNHADDWRRLLDLPADRRPTVVYCPRSHAFFGHESHPFREMLQAGVSVAIGTDSAASHEGEEARPLSVLDELRWLHAHCPDVPVQTLLQMATVHGAAGLGFSEKIGRIAAGYDADLAAFDVGQPPSGDPLTGLLEDNRPACLTCVAGRIVDARTGTSD